MCAYIRIFTIVFQLSCLTEASVISMEFGEGSHGGEERGEGRQQERRLVGLIYGDDKLPAIAAENPSGIRAIWDELQSAGIIQRCMVFSGKEAVENKHIAPLQTNLIKNMIDFDSEMGDEISAKMSCLFFNEGSSSKAASLAIGSVIEVAEKVAKRELDSAVAIVKPPGHHAAEGDEQVGFCLYSNVAVATSSLLDERSNLGINKILIVDWDIHHGFGSQKMFWKDPRVLVFSVHRYEFGSFYPVGDDGSHLMIGEGPGVGHNIKVPWKDDQCSDADYRAVWDYVLIPVVKEFNPDLIIISAGFDAAIGDPFGGCRVTPFGYSMMLKKLLEFAQGKIVMALERGYNVKSLASSVLICVVVLLEDKPVLGDPPFESTWRVIQAVREELSTFWPTLGEKSSKKSISGKATLVQISSSDSDAEDEDVEEAGQDVMHSIFHQKLTPSQVRERKTYVWYGTYGSNMSYSRFLCYIKGGKDEGMKKPCKGARDKTPPKGRSWMTVCNRLFFGLEKTKTWGCGGVAFLNPEMSSDDEAHIHMYRITLEQFNDVILQENGYTKYKTVFGLSELKEVVNKSFFIVPLKQHRYHNILYLKAINKVPILTITCTFDDMEKFKNTHLPIKQPAKKYEDTLVKALVKGNRLSEAKAKAYIEKAYTKPLIAPCPRM